MFEAIIVQNNFQELIKLKNSKEWIEFENYYIGYNIFDQLDFFRFEDIHTNILKSLFMRENPYGLYIYPLKNLLELLIVKGKSKIIEIDRLSELKIDNVNVKTQVVIDKKNKLDLLIELKINNTNYNIILENKIESKEHDDQCKRYYEYFSNLKDDSTKYIFVYLSFEKDPKFKERDKYICIDYQELIDYVIEPCSHKCDVKNPKIIDLNSYLSSFSKLFDFTNLSNKELIIPITGYGKKLTHNLNLKYGKLLMDILDKYSVSKAEDSSQLDSNLKGYLDFYELYKNILNIYYYNLSKISEDKDIISLLENKLFKIKAKFNGVSYQTYKECCVNILKYLIDNKIVKNDSDLEKLNNCIEDKHYVIASKCCPNDKSENTYTTSHKKVGEIYLNGDMLYYCDYTVKKDELEYFVNEINKTFGNVLGEEVIIY